MTTPSARRVLAFRVSILIALGIVGACGCGGADPLYDFESILSYVDREVQSALPEAVIDRPIQFDVRKTESLKSPFNGFVNFSYSLPPFLESSGRDEFSAKRKVHASYYFGNGKWSCEVVSDTVDLDEFKHLAGPMDDYDAAMFGIQYSEQTRVILGLEQLQESKLPLVKLLRDAPGSVHGY